MRKVRFNKWIPIVWAKEMEGIGYVVPITPVKGTGCFEKDFPNDGIFLQWANTFNKTESDMGCYTVALIELLDGTVLEVEPINIKFIKPTVLP